MGLGRYMAIVYVVKGVERGGCVSATFIQILKAVVLLGDVALDRSVPTPLHLRRYLRHIKPLNYLAKNNLRPPVLALSSC